MDNKLPNIEQTIVIEAPIEKVWDQVATSEGMKAWFMPNDFQAKVGHEFHLQSPFGPSPCKVTEVDPPHRLSFTWDTEGWYVTFILKSLGETTEFTLIHGGWKHPDELIGKANEKSSVIRDRMSGGWIGITDKLREILES